MSNDITLLALRLFVDVATHGSFSEVARRRGLPTSSVSRHISALEQSLGQSLLFRSTRAVRLTDSGARYFEELRRVLDTLDMASEQVGTAAHAPRGILRVNAPVAFGRRHVARHLAAFQQRHPALEVDLVLTDAFVDPIAEGADVVLRVGALQDRSLVTRKLADQRYVVAAAPDYVQRHGAPDSPAALRDHNCLIYQGRRGPMQWLFRQGNDPLRPQAVAGNLRSNDADSLIEAALQGQGVVLFPTWLLHDPVAQGRLVPLLAEWQAGSDALSGAIHFLMPQNRLRSAKVTAFVSFLIEVTGKPPHWDSLG